MEGIWRAAILLALVTAANVSHAVTVLWFDVENPTVRSEEAELVTEVSASAYASADGKTINAARVRVEGTDTFLSLYAPALDEQDNPIPGTWVLTSATEIEFGDDGSGNWSGTGWTAADMGEYGGQGSSYSFLVELGNVDAGGNWSGTLAVSEAVSYADLGAHISEGGIANPTQTPWTPLAFKAVPEPSTILLFLFGCAALGTRRRFPPQRSGVSVSDARGKRRRVRDEQSF